MFPGHDGPDSPHKGNLSWRVHLLPFLGESALYKRFDLEQAWDSEHNKPFIEQIPNVFRGKGIEKTGHTSIHVFVGEETPFSDDIDGCRIRNFTAGASNTILTVAASPETVEPWTKPGGIPFMGDTLLESLGIIGEQLLSGGSVRTFDTEIAEDALSNLIRHQDGNVIGNF